MLSLSLDLSHASDASGLVATDTDAVSYVNAVQSQPNGQVSAEAQRVLNDAFTTTFGGLKLADYKAKLRFLWAPLSNFSAIHVPLIGNNFVNNGFVAGAWDIKTGLVGNNVAYMTTPYTALDTALNNVSLGAYLVQNNSVNNEVWVGSVISNFTLRLGSGVAKQNNIFDCYNTTTGRIQTSGTLVNSPGFGLGRRNGNASTIYFGTNLIVAGNNSGGVRPAGNISIFGVTDMLSLNVASRFSAFVYGDFLTDAEATSLRLMLEFIQTARGGL